MNASFTQPFQTNPTPSMMGIRRLQRRHAQLAPRGQRPTDRLFVAVLPPPDVAARIGDLARRLRLGHGLSGRPLEAEHFHVTLFHVGDGIGLPLEIVDAVTERTASVAMPPFKIAFDRVESFRNGAFVLRGDESVIGLEVLHQRLSDAFDTRPGLARAFTPHLTLLRDSHLVDEHYIEPIDWTVREVVLVHSLLGRTTHRHLARLPLA